MRVLLSAYACSPNSVSESNVGWNFAIQASRYHAVTLLTRANNVAEIVEEIEQLEISNLEVVPVELPYWLRFWKKKSRGAMLYHYMWQLTAYIKARQLHKEKQFDLAHHVTFAVTWQPCWLAFLPIPVVWGPLDGVPSIPMRFIVGVGGYKDLLLENIRGFTVFMGSQFDLANILAMSRVNRFLVRTQSAMYYLPDKLRSKCTPMLESGTPPNLFKHVDSSRNSDSLFTVGCVGRLVYRKGFHLAIRAFANALSINPHMRLLVIGNGPEMDTLLSLVAQLNITSQVDFLGALTHAEVLEKMGSFNVFLYPSLRDGGANVLHEAMLERLPIVCLDCGGPAEMVTSDTGIKIPLSSSDMVIGDLAKALVLLSSKPDLCLQMGNAAYMRQLEVYDWNKKGDLLNEIYLDCISTQS